MKRLFGILGGVLVAFCARAEVHVFVRDTNGVAWVNYECTSGEIVRAFSLNITADRGQILGVSDFFRGPGTAAATGYGIFPTSFRDQFQGISGTNVNWAAAGYTPLANPLDYPADTLPGLNSGGITLELGGLWDPVAPAATPAAAGTLCALHLSEPAVLSITTNSIRGGIVGAIPGQAIVASFSSAPVGPLVVSVAPAGGNVTIQYNGGELQTAPNVNGPWTGTGDVSGTHTEPLSPSQTRFYRVRGAE